MSVRDLDRPELLQAYFSLREDYNILLKIMSADNKEKAEATVSLLKQNNEFRNELLEAYGAVGIIEASKDGVLRKYGWEELPWSEWFETRLEAMKALGKKIERPDNLKKLPRGAKVIGNDSETYMPVYLPIKLYNKLKREIKLDGDSINERVCSLVEDHLNFTSQVRKLL